MMARWIISNFSCFILGWPVYYIRCIYILTKKYGRKKYNVRRIK